MPAATPAFVFQNPYAIVSVAGILPAGEAGLMQKNRALQPEADFTCCGSNGLRIQTIDTGTGNYLRPHRRNYPAAGAVNQPRRLQYPEILNSVMVPFSSRSLVITNMNFIQAH
jgi:hypothetical protein